MVTQAFRVRTPEPSIKKTKLAPRLCPSINAYLLHTMHSLHPYLSPACCSHKIHL